jgi:hypothetical protein
LKNPAARNIKRKERSSSAEPLEKTPFYQNQPDVLQSDPDDCKLKNGLSRVKKSGYDQMAAALAERHASFVIL